jgi:tRNA dimethylallyltransferase
VTHPHPIAIVGPTAVGKSAVADALAARLGGEIVNADSMQVYRGMDIGTAKTPVDVRSVPYHCLDLIDPGTPYSAALYQTAARRAIDDILGRGRIPLMVGGTGLYLRAALDELEFPQGERTSVLRRKIETRAQSLGPEALHAELAARDPQSAALIHPNNVRRTVRALEMLAEGSSYADQASGFSARRLHYPGTRLIGLALDRVTLYERIDHRVDTMLASGLLDEVHGLVQRGFREGLTATQAIGYKELVPVVEGEADLGEAVAAIKQASRRYAKRQLTWFSADPRIEWIDVTGLSPEQALGVLLDLLESAKH